MFQYFWGDISRPIFFKYRYSGDYIPKTSANSFSKSVSEYTNLAEDHCWLLIFCGFSIVTEPLDAQGKGKVIPHYCIAL